METILSWVVNAILNWLLKRVETEIATAKEAHDKAVERGETNAENLKKYESAQTEAEQIQAALDLLNRRRS
jgi:hypothetical protein